MRIESLHDILCQYPNVDGFWNSDDLAITELRIRQNLARPDLADQDMLESLTQLARVQGLQGFINEANATLEQARAQIFPEGGPSTRAQIRYYLEKGRLLCLVMTPSKAQSFFNQALELSLQMKNDFFAVDAALMLSVSQPPKFQNEWLKKALQLAEESTDPAAQLWLSHLYVMQGWHQFDFRRFDEALESFQKALDQPRAEDEESRAKALIIQWCVARTLRALNRVQESLDIQQQLLTQLRSLGKVNGHVFLEIAECFQRLKQQEDARSYFESAYMELSGDDWYCDNKAADLSRMQHLYKKR